MGAEQSGTAGKTSGKDDCGVYDKPIGGDLTRPRGKLTSTTSLQGDASTTSSGANSAGSHSPPISSGGGGNGEEPGSLGSRRSRQFGASLRGPRDIVVVREGQSHEKPAPDLQRLAQIPIFGPLLRAGQQAGNRPSSEYGERLDHKAIMHFCVRYQEHLKQCAEAVTFDQNNLCLRMKEVDFDIKSLHDILADRQKKYARHSDQLAKVQEMRQVLSRVRTTADTLAHSLDQLNDLLPVESRLEPFRFLPDGAVADG